MRGAYLQECLGAADLVLVVTIAVVITVGFWQICCTLPFYSIFMLSRFLQ